MLERNAGENKYKSSPTWTATYTATVVEDCTVGLLTLEDCRTIFDTNKTGKASPVLRLVNDSQVSSTEYKIRLQSICMCSV